MTVGPGADRDPISPGAVNITKSTWKPRLRWFAASAFLLGFGAWVWGFLGPAGFTEGKSILSRLQGLEMAHRLDRMSTPRIFATDKDTGPIVVVATHDPHFPYAWIAAAIPSCDGAVCMVGGDAAIDIACGEVDRLEARAKMVLPVRQMLERHCHAA